jgi:Na+-transporting NADH:ubiquinone oxidoreductase subunit C
MPRGDTYTIFFAAVICVVCSVLLSATSAALKKQQDLMIELDRKVNVLKAMGVPVVENGKPISSGQVAALFAQHIEEIIIDRETGQPVPDLTTDRLSRDQLEQVKRKSLLPLYRWKDGDEVTRYAFPVSGKGLWSTVYGYLALEKDLATLAGATFYRHGETPGLGGEISTGWFQGQFKGKQVFANGRLQRLEVVKGKVADRYPQGSNHAVDGISGATLTGKGMNLFLNQDLENYEKYFRGIRKG